MKGWGDHDNDNSLSIDVKWLDKTDITYSFEKVLTFLQTVIMQWLGQVHLLMEANKVKKPFNFII